MQCSSWDTDDPIRSRKNWKKVIQSSESNESYMIFTVFWVAALFIYLFIYLIC